MHKSEVHNEKLLKQNNILCIFKSNQKFYRKLRVLSKLGSVD